VETKLAERVSEIVTIDEVKKWEKGDVITITAGTGTGKSYFIKNILYAHAKKEHKKILMLIHRTNCVDQFQKEIERDKKTDIIDIKTYQSLEVGYINKRYYDFYEYKYIVCDEFHYFMSDAAFNKYTDISLDMLLHQKSHVRIFMSATSHYMKGYINNVKEVETIDYKLPIRFDFIKELTFYNKDSTLEEFIDGAIEKKDKAIFFIQSAQKAYELYKNYKEHALFNCSTSNEEFYKYVDSNAIDKMLENERFDKSILITTTTMDAGVNIIDDELKHIVCDVKDIGTLIQCIGRKRLKDKNDFIYVYIKTITNKQLGGMKKRNKEIISKAEFLRWNTVRNYIIKYPRDNDYYNIVYDDTVKSENQGTKKVNELMYYKRVIDSMIFDKMIEMGNYGYCKYLASEFGHYESTKGYTYRLIEEEQRNDMIEKYLAGVVGKKLYKDYQKTLIEIVSLKDSRGRLQKSIELLNAYFAENKMPYMLVSKQTSETVDGKKKYIRYWELLDDVNIC
jgi:hypothetical protein